MLEKVKLETELLRYVVLAVLAMGGGSFGSLMSNPSGLRLALAIGGLLVSVVFIGIMYMQYTKIDTLIQKGAEHESE